MKKVFLKTYGCQMNERDSEAVAAMLRQRGYALTASEQDADVVLLNTCSVRDLAEQKALGKMGMLAHLKRRRPHLILGYMGCMAESRGAELLENPAVNLVVGTQKFHKVPDHLDALISADSARIVDTGPEAGSESAIKDHLPGPNGEQKVTAFVSIQQGCDMHCTFCIVPFTRGTERSRPISEIVEEVRGLLAEGVKEITLLGQIVTSYGRHSLGRSGFVRLLEAVHDLDGLERLRFTSPHPKGFGEELIEAYRRLPKLCEHAHLPAQSGSDRILKLMKRGYNRQSFLRIVEKLRAARPGIALSTDIIVGFPGETEADFEQTVSLMREVEFDQAYIFKYSPRRGTAAAGMAGQLPEPVKEQRHQQLLAIQNEIMTRKNNALIGQTVEILVEGRSEKGGRRMFGRTRTNKIVVFDGSDRHRGELLPVRIERATASTLYGDAAIHGVAEVEQRAGAGF
jgi:tRNA-2-methylthio-N6-dimethylallyladenosine synthase